MAWLIPAVVATLLGTLILTLTYGFLYIEERQVCIGLWTLAWAVYNMRFVFRLLILESAEPSLWLEAGLQIAVIANAFLLLSGTNHFVHNKALPRYWLLGAIALSVWSVAGVLYAFSFDIHSTPVFIWASAIYAFTGTQFLRKEELPYSGRRVVGIIFVLWAAHKLNFPILGQAEGVAPWGYLLGAALELLAAFGILLLYFQQNRAELAKSEHRLRQVLTHMPVMLTAVDDQHRLVEWNAECERVTGYRQAEIADNHAAVIQMYGSIENNVALLQATQAAAPAPVEWTIFNKDGSLRTINWYNLSEQVKIPDWHNWMIGVDITDLKNTEQALRDSEANYASLIQNSPSSIMVVQEGRYVFANPMGATRLGYDSPADLVGMLAIDSIAPEYREIIQQRMMEIASGATNTTLEMKLQRTDGSSLHVESTSVPIIYEGKPAALVIGNDITERKKVETELTRYRQNLESLVEERTARLQVANEELKALSRVKDEFVSNVSHELRTPIANLKVYHHLIMRKPEALTQYMETIRRETDRLENLIESLLQLSRLDQARIPFHFATLDLNALAGNFAADRRTLAAEKSIHLDLVQAEALPPVTADRKLLEQALSVLLTNALAYTPAGGRVSIFTTTRQQDGSIWIGTGVSDTGPGIAPDELPHLFERFYRGVAAQGSAQAGTGLGLAIAREIVARHAGYIEAASAGTPGNGATFTIWLPMAQQEGTDSLRDTASLPVVE